MRELIINGISVGKIKARRYARNEGIDGVYNDWSFLMDGGYTVKVEGRNMKDWRITSTLEEIITFEN